MEKRGKLLQFASDCSEEQAVHCSTGPGRTAETSNGAQLTAGKLKYMAAACYGTAGWLRATDCAVGICDVKCWETWAALYPCQIGKEKMSQWKRRLAALYGPHVG